MCGRYTLAHAEAAKAALERLGIKMSNEVALPTRYNVAPTQIMPVVRGDKLTAMKWGVMRTIQGKPKLVINARSETAATKFSFRDNVKSRRCIIPADGFFEWLRSPDGKTRTPYWFRVKGGEPFWIAGIYDEASETVPPTSIPLTTAPNELIAPIHDRMPVILDDSLAKEWLSDSALTPERVSAICLSYPATAMSADQVNPIVNNARNDVPACIAPPRSDSVEDLVLE